MKLFYTAIEKQLLKIDDPATMALNSWLWKLGWNTWVKLDDVYQDRGLTNKEARLYMHLSGLLQL